MMKLWKTLAKTLHPLNSKIQNQFNPKFLHHFSTKFSPIQQQQNPQSQNNQANDQKIQTFPKFTQIPYQPKVANWVNLIGTIKIPIKFLTINDDESWAATLISQEQLSTKLPLMWMPVIFRGDLAHTAMMHFKENDTIYVGGHLSPEPIPIDLTNNNKYYFRVLVHDVYFVHGLSGMKKNSPGRSEYPLSKNSQNNHSPGRSEYPLSKNSQNNHSPGRSEYPLSKNSQNNHSPGRSEYPLSKNSQNNQANDQKIETLPKFAQIPYQSKVANWVNLIGTIKTPIKFLTSADGESWAATLIMQEQFSDNVPLKCMPVIFRGDLAHTAMMHFKENDTIYVGGHLSPEPVPIDLTNNKSDFQVLVHDVYFVRGLPDMKKNDLGRSKYPRNSLGNPTSGRKWSL